jgi:hypothetical protein
LKKKTYKVYEQDANLLEGIGEAELTDEKIKLAESSAVRYIFTMKHVENHAHVCLFMCCLQVI